MIVIIMIIIVVIIVIIVIIVMIVWWELRGSRGTGVVSNDRFCHVLFSIPHMCKPSC